MSRLLHIPLALWQAYVFVRLWTWFAVPLGAPAITVAHAVGLLALVWLAVSQPDVIGVIAMGDWSDKRKRHVEWTNVLVGALIPSASMLTGYIASRFM